MIKIRFSIFFITLLGLTGCSSHYSGTYNSAPRFFEFPSAYDTNHYMFYEKDYNILMAEAKSSDWIKMSGWSGAYIYNGIGMGVDNPDVKTTGVYLGYGINLSSNITKYTEREKAAERRDNSYIQYVRQHYQYPKNTKLYYETHGTENYPCIVKESKDLKRGKQKISYDCHKFNPTRTLTKSVTLVLIYTKAPNLPGKYKTLAKEYTYADLKRRARRMLDSLYIKDGW